MKEEVSKLNQRALEAEAQLEDTSEQLRQARRVESERGATLPTSVLPIPEASTSGTTLSQVCAPHDARCRFYSSSSSSSPLGKQREEGTYI